MTRISPLTPGSQSTAATFSAPSVAFGSQAVGLKSIPQTVTIMNSGNSALNVIGIAVTGTNGSDYAQTSTCPSWLATGSSCAISVTFTPTAIGARMASISVTDNASGGVSTISLAGTGQASMAPMISRDGIVPLDSTASSIQAGEWVSIYGSNLAAGTTVWNGDFPTSLGGTSVQIDGKTAFLSLTSPGQINLQAPADGATGTATVVVYTAAGSASSTVTLVQIAPSFCLFDTKHVAGIILRPDGSGTSGGGAYDILGPNGNALGYPSVAAKAGDTVELFGVGFGPTNPSVMPGQAFSGAAPTTNPVNIVLNNVNVAPSFAGLSSAGLYQMNLTIPAGLGMGDVPLVALVGGAQTQSGVVISLQ